MTTTMTDRIFHNRYRVEKLLGQGGMGCVYLCHRLDDNQPVVVKVMHECFATDRRLRLAFQREMVLMTRFRHPYAVSFLDATMNAEELPCIVMEYVPGVSLAELIEASGFLPLPRAGRMIAQLCQVLQGAHDNGIIHRDLTPANVMVKSPGTAAETIKVMDFGLSRIGGGFYIPLEKLEGDDNNIGGGTPDYVSPEQIRGDAIDHRADIYSLGVLMYKMLTGYLPFESAATTEQILDCHLNYSPPHFADLRLRHEIPIDIERLVFACLAKYPSERPQSALKIVPIIERALGHALIEGDPIPATMLPAPREVQRIDARTVIDSVEAWMPEPIAVVKLRGFFEDLGGDVLESEPGIIRFRMPDTSIMPQAPKNRSLLSIIGFGKPTQTLEEYVLLELHMEKKESPRNHLLLTIIMKPESDPNRLDDPKWREWCKLVCRELRSYLIGF